jgi:hypothetical protein
VVENSLTLLHGLLWLTASVAVGVFSTWLLSRFDRLIGGRDRRRTINRRVIFVLGGIAGGAPS